MGELLKAEFASFPSLLQVHKDKGTVCLKFYKGKTYNRCSTAGIGAAINRIYLPHLWNGQPWCYADDSNVDGYFNGQCRDPVKCRRLWGYCPDSCPVKWPVIIGFCQFSKKKRSEVKQVLPLLRRSGCGWLSSFGAFLRNQRYSR